MYVDCQNGSKEAIRSDEIGIIGVFDAATRNYITKYNVTRVGPNRINEVNYNCVKPPTGVCVDEYIYRTTQNIDPGDNGKILAFQRCCRNNSINNIIAPESTGATFWVKIPPKSTQNNSAVFKTLPPNYVCVNAPLTFDHSATDVDGDSLVYFLNQPFAGASSNQPRPDPPEGPNYQNINWGSGYNTFNQVSGSPKMSINPKTGELTVTPDKIGQYVIGIVVREYRKGKLVGETYRDYQMNVIKCDFDILADFTTSNAGAASDAYVFECQDTVFFVNRSQKALTYEWDFGDPSTTDDTSTALNPWYIYPGNGDYRVTLKVTNELCEDEYTFLIRIRSTKSFTLGPDLIFCREINQILDTKTPEATRIEWNNGLFGQRIRASDTGVYIATVSFGQCVYADTMRIDAYPVMFQIPDDSLFCEEVDMTIDAGISGLDYAWNTGVNDTTQSIHVTEAGVYIVAVSNAYCTELDTIRIWQASEPSIPDAFFCGEFDHEVYAGEFEEGEFLWSNGSQLSTTNFVDGGKQWLQLRQRHCVSTDSFEILNPRPTVKLGEDIHFCDQVDLTLDAGEGMAEYYWSTDQTSKSISVHDAGTYWVLVEDEYGCEASDTIGVSMSLSPLIDLGEDTTICVRSFAHIGVLEQSSIISYEWSNGATDRVIAVDEEGIYTLKVTDDYGCIGKDSIEVIVDPFALPNVIYIPNAFSPNGDNLNDYFPYKEPIPQPGYYIVIYSRWGEKIFDSRTSENQNWDGTYKGKRVPNETFIYYAEYFSCSGLKKALKGTINPVY